MKSFFYCLLFFFSIAVSYWIEPLFIFISFAIIWFIFHQNTKLVNKLFVVFLLLLFWNIVPVYWLSGLHFWKGVLAYFVFTLLYFFVFLLALFVKKYSNKNTGSLSLIILWMWIEYSHHFSDFGWTWMILGNVFSLRPEYIQWYSYTGVFGGSIWIWLISYLIYHTIQNNHKWYYVLLVILLFIPFFFPKNKIIGQQKTEVIYVQLDKSFDKLTDVQKTDTIIKKIEKEITKKTQFIILPEIFFSDIWFHSFENHLGYTKFRNLVNKYPNTSFVIGANLLKIPLDTTGSHLESRSGIRYKKYNIALYISKKSKTKIKGKKFLVPLSEYMPPYVSYFINEVSNYQRENVTTNVFGIDNIFTSNFICYEASNSILTAQQQHDELSNFITMIANESFFKNEYARKHYLNICLLRSIEANKYIIKSTQEGTACVIDNKGVVEEITLNQIFKIRKTIISLQKSNSFYIQYYYIWFYFLFSISILLINVSSG